MPLHCTPFALPQEWGQFDHEGDNQLLIVYVNAGTSVDPDWRSAVFDLEEFTRSSGRKRIVQYHAADLQLQTVSLPQWVNLQKAGLRGNTRGVLYYDKKDGWLRLGELLPVLTEVIIENAAEDASAGREAAAQAAVDAAHQQEWSLNYYNYDEEIAVQWEQQEVLGEGGFGKVVKATLRGVDVAIKVVAGHGVSSASGTESFLAEVNHVSRLQRNCEHIVKLLGFSHRPDGAICLVYELANQGSLRQLPDGFSLHEALGLFRQFAVGLQHMHSCHVVHADIKPPNLLLHKLPDGRLRGFIGDLGVAELVPPGSLGVGPRGTAGFQPPECRRRNGYYGYPGDVFAYGITMGMLAGNINRPQKITICALAAMNTENSPPSRRAAQQYVEVRILRRFGLPEMRCPSIVRRLVHLIFQCCYGDEGRRPTAARIVTKLGELAALSLED